MSNIKSNLENGGVRQTERGMKSLELECGLHRSTYASVLDEKLTEGGQFLMKAYM